MHSFGIIMTIQKELVMKFKLSASHFFFFNGEKKKSLVFNLE